MNRLPIYRGYTEEDRTRIRNAVRAIGDRLLQGEVTAEREPVHYVEPDLHPEVTTIQDKMLARFGKHTGRKENEEAHHIQYGSNLERYGMRICRGCGRLTQTDFPGCSNCDDGKQVIENFLAA